MQIVTPDKDTHRLCRFSNYVHVTGFMVCRDNEGKTGFTRLHPKGHLHTRAAIANVLRHAAAARHIPSDHAIFIEKARQLRKRGTWL